MPAYNAATTIQAALDSVFAQTCPPSDIIFVDDGSTDDTASVVAAYGGRIRRLWQPNAGPAVARNLGLTHATGDLIACLDADDLWLPHTLQALLAALAAHPAAAITQGHIQDMWLDGQGGWRLDPPRRAFNLGSALFRRAVFDQVGLFNPRLRQSEDIEFWIRVREHGVTVQPVDAVTLLYRRKPPQPDDRRLYHSHWLHNLKRSLDRQRAR